MTQDKQLPKKELILQAAASVFTSKGFYDAKIDEIAQKAGVGKGTVYEYFKSKGELFYQVHKESISTYCTMIEKEVDMEHTTKEKLLAIVKKTLKIGAHMIPSGNVSVVGTYIKDENFILWLRGMINQHMEFLEGIIREGVNKGEIKPVNEKILSRLLFGGVGFLIGPIGRINLDKVDIDQLAAEIVEYYFTSIEI